MGAAPHRRTLGPLVRCADEVGHVVRCTPTLRNVKESNAKSKAQLIVLQNGVSQLVITFRTSKAEYSDDKIRAAKIRFMLIFLPHLKGSTIDDFCSYYLEVCAVPRARCPFARGSYPVLLRALYCDRSNARTVARCVWCSTWTTASVAKPTASTCW